MAGSPIENWRSLTGPSGWFELWHPPQWHVEEQGGTQALAPPGSDAEFTLLSVWSQLPDVTDATSEAKSRWPLTSARNIEPVSDEAGPHCEFAFVGQQSWYPSASRWRRIFRRPKWRNWCEWIIRKGPVIVLARLDHGSQDDPELTTLCRMLLQSIDFAPTPAAPPDVFAERVLELSRRRFPLLQCRRGDGLQIAVGESTLNLFNFYRTYLRAPDRFEEIVLPALTTVVQVQEWGDAETRPPLDRVRERIMPMLYPESAWQDKFAGFVGTPWVAGLAVLYVVDEAHAYWYIPQDLLAEWGLTEDELHSLSLENLERYFEEHPMELAAAGTDSGATDLLMPVHSDAYNAARIVSGRFTARLRASVGGDLAVGVPGRDFFVAVGLKSPEMLEHVRARVREDFVNMDHPLTDRLLLLTTDGACEYCDPETA